eukprot:160071_1
MEEKQKDNDSESKIQNIDIEFERHDIYDLYNAIQTPFQTIFIDIRSNNKFQVDHPTHFINIPINTNNEFIQKQLNNIIRTFYDGMEIDIFCCANAKQIKNKVDIKWCETIYNQIRCNKSYNKYTFTRFNMLNCCYSQFKKNIPFLCTKLSRTECQIFNRYPNHIINNLYLGDRGDAKHQYVMRDLGITHIINITEDIKNVFENDGIKYLNIKISDDPYAKIDKILDECIAFIDNCIHKQNVAVLVHCVAGVSRSAIIVIAYMMKRRNMKYLEAMQYVKKRRNIINPNYGFCNQLKHWEQNGYKTKIN